MRFPRPAGQPAGARCRTCRASAPSRRLDYELELGFFVGRPNPLGEPDSHGRGGGAPVRRRPAQRLERARHPGVGVPAARTVPLEEFLLDGLAVDRDARGARAVSQRRSCAPKASRNRCPISTRRAIATPARSTSCSRPGCRPAKMRALGDAGQRLSRSNALDAYWTAAQLVAHHTVNGCNLNSRRPARLGHAVGPAARARRLAARAHAGRQGSR